ncbi:hypothetical protein [Actinosynnema sp. NPDC020468]|uniref:hypothetical protein n=1 Tax=Actinosynnema sp. NPDC020468 TaxID=3154488 RepID=UPI0033FF13C9
MSDDGAWLVLGGLHHLNGSTAPGAHDVLVLVPLAAAEHRDFPSNTVVLRWADLGEVELRARTSGSARGRGAAADGAELFPDMLPGKVLTDLVAGLSEQDDRPRPLVPLWYLAVRDGELHVHAQVRFRAEDACFIRITPAPIPVADVGSLEWLPEAVARHAERSLFLNNHQRYYRKCFPGKELEYKYTLAPPVDVWTLTTRIHQRLVAGALPGYLVEYRDEFQAWDYGNHLYHVTAPEEDRGYVSFIPTTDGRNLVKRKWYKADAFDRRESHTYGVVPEHGFDEYVRSELGVTATRLPPFRRVRYDVNFESARTGHVYGIFFDHVSLVAAPDVVLNQCELEYLRSRTVLEPSEQDVLAEIEEIALWLEAFLREHGLTDERGFYSKLTFLLDSVAARPDLASEVS